VKNKIILRKSGTDLLQVKIEEGHVDPINNVGDPIYNFHKELVYSGEEKVLEVSPRVITDSFVVDFQHEKDEYSFLFEIVNYSKFGE